MRFSGIIAAFVVCLTSNFTFAQNSDALLTNHADSVAYAFGLSIGDDLKRTGIEELNTAVLATAVKSALAGHETGFDDELVGKLIMQTITEARDKANAKLMDSARAFMETNRARQGVKVTASGLQYEVLKEGNGAKPTTADSVTVHYRGELTDGRVFDNSYERGEPLSFSLSRVIAGWQEGLQLMAEGSHYRLYIPYELGYGERGAGQDIPPFSPLIFDVELIAVKKATVETTPIKEEVTNEAVR